MFLSFNLGDLGMRKNLANTLLRGIENKNKEKLRQHLKESKTEPKLKSCEPYTLYLDTLYLITWIETILRQNSLSFGGENETDESLGEEPVC